MLSFGQNLSCLRKNEQCNSLLTIFRHEIISHGKKHTSILQKESFTATICTLISSPVINRSIKLFRNKATFFSINCKFTSIISASQLPLPSRQKARQSFFARKITMIEFKNHLLATGKFHPQLRNIRLGNLTEKKLRLEIVVPHHGKFPGIQLQGIVLVERYFEDYQ